MIKTYLLTILLISTSVDFSQGQDQIVMSTSQKGNIGLSIAGSGAITIEWGDNTEKVTHTLLSYNSNNKDFAAFTFNNTDYRFEHTYSNTDSHKITITGGTITHLKVAFIGLTDLDITKSNKLTQLFCGGSFLTKLNLNNNINLTHLAVNASRLESLDISDNRKLKILNCVGNKLKYLDIRNHSELTYLSLYNNQLERLDAGNNGKLNNVNITFNSLKYNEINKFFETLNNNSTKGEKMILINSNPGTSDCNPNIAIKKGWTVISK